MGNARTGFGASVVALAIAIAGLGPVPSAMAAANSLSVTPVALDAAMGETVVVRVKSTAAGPLSGAGASLLFDNAHLQLLTVSKGPDWVAAGAGFAGYPSSQKMAAFITNANSSGKVPTIAAYFLDGGTLDGEHVLWSATFEVVACGDSVLGLPIGPSDGAMLDGARDSYGDALPTTGQDGAITTPCERGQSQAIRPDATPQTSSAPQPSSNPAPSGPAPGADQLGNVRGLVLGDGGPIDGATVGIYVWPTQRARQLASAGTPIETPFVADVVTDAAGEFALVASDLPDGFQEPNGVVNLEARITNADTTVMWHFALDLDPIASVDAPTAVALRVDLGPHPAVDETENPAASWSGQSAEVRAASNLTKVGAIVLPEVNPAVQSATASPDLLEDPCAWVPANNFKFAVPEMFASVWGWQQAKAEVYESTSSSHTLGLAFKDAQGNWSQSGSATWTATSTSAGTAPDLWDNYIGNKVNYQEWDYVCPFLGAIAELWQPHSVSSLLDPILGFNHGDRPDWSDHFGCTEVSTGTRVKSTGTNTTQAAGVGFGPINLSAQAGWDDDVKVTWTFRNSQPSWLCGSTNFGWADAPEAEAQAAPPVADIDLNGGIGLTDIGQITGKWNRTGEAGWLRADVDHNGGVGLSDIGRITGRWGAAGYHSPY